MTGHGTGAAGRLAAWRYALRTTNPAEGASDPVSRWLVATRAAVLPMTLTAGAVAALLAAGRPGLDVLALVLAVLGITLAHVANNLMNDLFDTQVGGDTSAYPRSLYAPHPILSGLVTRRQLLAAILVTNLADLAILVVLAFWGGWPIVAFALAGFVLSVAYTAPPLRLKERGLGEADVLVVWGPLMVGGTYYAALGELPWEVLLVAFGYGGLCTAVLMGKHIDKLPYDAATGTRTLPVVLGEPAARMLTRWLMAGYYAVVLVCVAVGAVPWPALLTLAALPALVKAWRKFGEPRPAEPPRGLVVWPLWFAAIAFLHARRAGALLLLGLAVGAALRVWL